MGKQPAVQRQPEQPVSPVADVPANLPPELARLKRPKVSVPLGGSLFGLLFAIPWTLFSIFFIFFPIGITQRDYQEYNRLLQEGVITQAVITKMEVDDSGDSTSYYVYYRYAAKVNGDSTTLNKSDSVSSDVYNSLEIGGKVEVIYAASEPELSMVKAQHKPPTALPIICGSGMGLVFSIFGVFMLINGIKAGMNLWYLRTEGQLTQGLVFDRWTDSDSDGTNYYVAYAFRASSSQTGPQTFSKAVQSSNVYNKVKVGDRVSIRYLPDDPNVCQLADFRW